MIAGLIVTALAAVTGGYLTGRWHGRRIYARKALQRLLEHDIEDAAHDAHLDALYEAGKVGDFAGLPVIISDLVPPHTAILMGGETLDTIRSMRLGPDDGIRIDRDRVESIVVTRPTTDDLLPGGSQTTWPAP